MPRSVVFVWTKRPLQGGQAEALRAIKGYWRTPLEKTY
jgi:hypothetical protein